MIREAHPSGYYCLAHMDGKDLLDPINGKWLKHYYALKKKEIMKLPLLFNEFYVSLFFSLQVTMSQDKIVTCFHEYVIKKYKYYESILCHSNSKSSNKV